MHRTLLPGHGLVRQKGVVFHTGTYLGRNQVAHIGPQGFRIDTLEVFAAGQRVEITGRPVQVDILQLRLQEARRLLSTYDPLFENCEHLSNFLQRGIRESPQVQGALIGFTAGTLVASRMPPAAGVATALFFAWAGVQLARPSAVTPAHVLRGSL